NQEPSSETCTRLPYRSWSLPKCAWKDFPAPPSLERLQSRSDLKRCLVCLPYIGLGSRRRSATQRPAAGRTIQQTRLLACASHPKVESKHSQNVFSVNVFAIAKDI